MYKTKLSLVLPSSGGDECASTIVCLTFQDKFRKLWNLCATMCTTNIQYQRQLQLQLQHKVPHNNHCTNHIYSIFIENKKEQEKKVVIEFCQIRLVLLVVTLFDI